MEILVYIFEENINFSFKKRKQLIEFRWFQFFISILTYFLWECEANCYRFDWNFNVMDRTMEELWMGFWPVLKEFVVWRSWAEKFFKLFFFEGKFDHEATFKVAFGSLFNLRTLNIRDPCPSSTDERQTEPFCHVLRGSFCHNYPVQRRFTSF